jgi:hypothetical protein
MGLGTHVMLAVFDKLNRQNFLTMIFSLAVVFFVIVGTYAFHITWKVSNQQGEFLSARILDASVAKSWATAIEVEQSIHEMIAHMPGQHYHIEELIFKSFRRFDQFDRHFAKRGFAPEQQVVYDTVLMKYSDLQMISAKISDDLYQGDPDLAKKVYSTQFLPKISLMLEAVRDLDRAMAYRAKEEYQEMLVKNNILITAVLLSALFGLIIFANRIRTMLGYCQRRASDCDRGGAQK